MQKRHHSRFEVVVGCLAVGSPGGFQANWRRFWKNGGHFEGDVGNRTRRSTVSPKPVPTWSPLYSFALCKGAIHDEPSMNSTSATLSTGLPIVSPPWAAVWRWFHTSRTLTESRFLSRVLMMIETRSRVITSVFDPIPIVCWRTTAAVTLSDSFLPWRTTCGRIVCEMCSEWSWQALPACRGGFETRRWWSVREQMCSRRTQLTAEFDAGSARWLPEGHFSRSRLWDHGATSLRCRRGECEFAGAGGTD